MPQSDADLIRSARAGDGDAFAELMGRHTDRVYSFALSILRDPMDADDVAQETFIEAYKSIGRFDGRPQAGPWLLGIAANCCRVWRRRRRARITSLDTASDAIEDSEGGDASPSAEDEFAILRSRMDVERAVSDLPMKYRLPCILRFQQDLSYQEIADLLEVSIDVVSVRLHRARAILRRKLEPLGSGEGGGRS